MMKITQTIKPWAFEQVSLEPQIMLQSKQQENQSKENSKFKLKET